MSITSFNTLKQKHKFQGETVEKLAELVAISVFSVKAEGIDTAVNETFSFTNRSFSHSNSP